MKSTAAICLLLCSPAIAGSRGSANYTIATDTVDAGGMRTTSSNYTNDGGLGEITGISSVSSPAETVRSGYVAQLYEVTGLTLAATPANVNETGTTQLSAVQQWDDGSTAVAPASMVAWSVVSGPIAGISAGGLATASAVYQNTTATVQGTYAGLNGSLDITVLDLLPDNYPGYATDGLPDNWQVQYFGLPPNTDAGPTVDFDGDGQNNLFEYLAGTAPTNRASLFVIDPPVVLNPASSKRVSFHPALGDRTYTIQSSTDLTNWTPLASPLTGISGTYDFTDVNAGMSKKFYRVKIEKP